MRDAARSLSAPAARARGLRRPGGRWLACLLVVLSLGCSAEESGAANTRVPPGNAEQLFARYVALEQAFDPAVADLYTDHAVIRNRRRYPDGRVRTLEMPALRYKALIRTAMPLARANHDTSNYSNISYGAEGHKVRITATRYSVRKRYSSPLSLLAERTGDGSWRISEELSESRP